MAVLDARGWEPAAIEGWFEGMLERTGGGESSAFAARGYASMHRVVMTDVRRWAAKLSAGTSGWVAPRRPSAWEYDLARLVAAE